MSTKTSTEVKRKITRKGDLIVVQETEITTTVTAGKDPEVKEVTRVEEFKGEEGYKRLPEEIRQQLEGPSNTAITKPKGKPVNKEATRGNFLAEFLEEHNKLRKMHGVEPLKMSKELVKVSETRAKELAAKDEMSPRKDHAYGENVSCLWSSDPDHFVQAVDIVTRWYSEGQNYKYDIEPKELSAGHFTQMMWEGSKEIGVAAVKSNGNKIYVVAVYSPPGNYDGDFKKNVHPVGRGHDRKVFKTFNFPKFSILPKISYKPKPGESATPAKKLTPSEEFSKQSEEFSKLNKEGVKVHNEYRSMHGVPDLVYSEQLALYAQEWADELAQKEKFEHRKQKKYGENLYAFKSSHPDALASVEEACRSWYNEVENYNYDKETDLGETGHFTQVVWKQTAEVGFGRSKSKKGLQVIVANYNPPGNMIGTFSENVPKPIRSKPK